MHFERLSPLVGQPEHCSRRQFLGGAISAAAAAPLMAGAVGMAAEKAATAAKPASYQRKIKLGLVGLGMRGCKVGPMFQQHGGYELHSVADYFPEVVEKFGESWGVAKQRRFSGLSGYRKLIESGVEAVALIVPPCFFPEQASAAAAAGLHVYMAKPVAVDVPGCLQVEAAAKQATQKQRVFLIDYQLPVDPSNIAVAKLARSPDMGKIVRIVTTGVTGSRLDPPKTATIADRLQKEIWDCDMEIGGSFINSYDIHALHAAIWIVGQRPVAAMGVSRINRPDAHGTSHDTCSVVYEYADGLIHEHSGQSLSNGAELELSCKLFSQGAHATLNYYGKVHFQQRKQKPFDAEVVACYKSGTMRNIATFYEQVTAGRCENLTVAGGIDSCLSAILGREAALRHGRITMEELLKENKRMELDRTGLKV